jgi:peptide/nickel transport system ATP-binding protein
MPACNPKMRVRDILGEALQHAWAPGQRQAGHADRVAELLRLVGLQPEHAARFPHEFLRRPAPAHRRGAARLVGGSRNSSWPDEPLSALDVSIQAQVVNLLCDLRDQFSLTIAVHLARPGRGGVPCATASVVLYISGG